MRQIHHGPMLCVLDRRVSQECFDADGVANRGGREQPRVLVEVVIVKVPHGPRNLMATDPTLTTLPDGGTGVAGIVVELPQRGQLWGRARRSLAHDCAKPLAYWRSRVTIGCHASGAANTSFARAVGSARLLRSPRWCRSPSAASLPRIASAPLCAPCSNNSLPNFCTPETSGCAS